LLIREWNAVGGYSGQEVWICAVVVQHVHPEGKIRVLEIQTQLSKAIRIYRAVGAQEQV